MSKKIRYFLFLLLLIWLAGIFLNVLVPFYQFPAVTYLAAKICYSRVCHQITEKTIFIMGRPLFVCSRCLGIYGGLFAVSFISLLIPLKKRLPVKYLFISGIPMIIDVIMYSAKIYNYSKLIAFLTGLLLGSAGFFYILEAFEKFIAELKSQDRNLN